VFLEDSGNIRRKIVAMGALLVVAPLLMLLAAGWIVMQRISQAALMDGTKTSGANLTHLTRNLFGICRNYHQDTSAKLKSGRAILDEAGPIALDPNRQLLWQATNEATGEVTELSLPMMMAGSAKFVPIVDFTRQAPVVDEIERLYGTAATVFQRINGDGDMLRICSNVRSDDGTRSIGSFIPAKSPDGQATLALRQVLAAQTYLGRTFSGKTGYLAAYQPLTDQSGAVVGMLYTALPEDEIKSRIRQFTAGNAEPNHEELFVLRADGDERGTALIMGDKALEGRNLWDEKDSAGQPYVREICQRAVTLRPGDVAEYKYRKTGRVGGIPRTVIARFAYVPEWDWVVGFAQPEVNFLAGASAIQAVAVWGMWLLLGVGVAGSGLAIRVWIEYSGDLTHKLNSLLEDLNKDAKAIGVMASAISEEVERAKDALKPSSAGDVLAKAGRTAAEIGLAIRHIDASNASVSGVIGSIDQIAFATNMLAVNAAIETSQANGGNQAIAGIAEELRKLAHHCGDAARETRAAIERSRLELEKGNEEVARLVTDLRPGEQIPELRYQAENLRRLAEGIDQTLERFSADLGRTQGGPTALR
jgi:hypothetical protein